MDFSRTNEVLKSILKSTSHHTGQDFLNELLKNLNEHFGIRFSIITECINTEKTRVRTLSYCDRDDIRENFEYDLKGTPCKIIMNERKPFYASKEVCEVFPAEEGIQAYAGVPIVDNHGDLIGHIAIFDPSEFQFNSTMIEILKIFSERAAAEILRKSAEEKLFVAVDELKKIKEQLENEKQYLEEEIKQEHNFDEIVSVSPSFINTLKQAEQVARTDSTVLILGESGTGKELMARALHNLSARRNRPLVKINCAALPHSLIESELFGHEKGAFTGATYRKIGKFEQADKGTIFLDEIGELPIESQAKLLRVLQEGELERVGGTQTRKIDVRIIAATNRTLDKEISKGNFREDLYFRLNVFPITCPPLRDRIEDIPFLASYFIQKHGARLGKVNVTITKKCMEKLQEYNWPGNIRELENLIQRALILCKGDKLTKEDFNLPHIREEHSNGVLPLKEMEKNYLLSVLEKTNWKVSGRNGAASLLELHPSTLESRMKKLGISRPNQAFV